MRLTRRSRKFSDGRDRGQSLLETAIMVPVLLCIAFNAINLAYFWFMVLTLSAVPRLGAQYASQGGQSLATISAPDTSAVSDLVFENLTGAIGATTANASAQVCSVSKGVNNSTNQSLCDSFGQSFTFPAPAADPEAPLFILNRVDVAYTVQPLIPGGAFNVILPSNCTAAGCPFQRHVSMRSLY